MFFLITFSSTLYADAPGPVNLSLKGIVDWVRFFQFVEYGTALPSTPSTRGVWFILWVNDEPALYWSNGSEWIPFVSAGVQDGSVGTDALADGAVTTPKLAESAVDTSKLNNGAVTTNKIADNAVTGTKFANNSITTAKLANSSVTSEKLGYLSVSTNNIQNSAVTSEKIEATIQNKNLVLNNGATSTPSLSFSSNHFSGLSYDGTDNTIDVSISAFDKVRIGNTSTEFINMPDGIIISSFSEYLNINSDGINKDDLSLTLNGDIIASGSLLPSENIMFNLGSNSKKWNNLYVGNIFSDNEYVITTSLVPEVDNTGYVGSDTMRWGNMNAVNASFTLIDTDLMNVENASVTTLLTSPYIISNNISVDNLLATDSNIQNLEMVNSIYPSVDNTVEIGTDTLKIKSGDFYNLNIDDLNVANASFTNIQSDYILVDNASVTYALNASNIIASETIDTDYLSANIASFTNLNVDNDVVVSNNLEVKGIASVTSLLVNGAPLSGAENLKFPRGTLSVDIDCGKYSLRSLGKDLVLFSDAWMMIDYNVTDDGNYFTFKSGNASPAVMLMDSEITALTSLTIRLDYENIMSENSESILFGLENEYADHIITLYALNKKLYLRIDNINELMDFNYDGYDWSEEHNIYLTFSIDNNNIYYGLNIDGVEVYQNSNSITFTQFDIARVKIGAGYGSVGYYTTLKDYNAKYRRIQIYPYELSLKEMTSIPLLQPIVDQQRELSKNMTRCPYYTLGEPSVLIGGDFNEGEGFFGEVSGDKFIYGWEVLGQLWGMDMNVIDTKAKFIASFTEVFGSDISYTFTGDSYTALGVSDNLEVEWLKFYDHGKIIFIPKRPLLNNITWNEINNVLANCTVGKEIKIDLRRMNPLINSTYSNGNLISVRCRLLTGGNIQPFVYGNVNERGVKDNALCMGSEWNRLMYRICDQIPSDTFVGAMQGYSGGKQLGDNWFNYTGNMLGFGASNDLGRVTFTQEYCYYKNTAAVLYRAGEAGVGTVYCNTPSNRSAGRGFRPALVLEVLSQ